MCGAEPPPRPRRQPDAFWAAFWVVTDRGDTDYAYDEAGLEELLELWRGKGRVEFYVFKKEGIRR